MAQNLDSIFQSAADQYGIPVAFLKAIAQRESSMNIKTPDSPQGAKGLMQMLDATAKAMGADDPYDPAQAIPAAARYIREGLDKTGSLAGAAAYYHGGPDQRQWGPKTADYVKGVGDLYNKSAQGGTPSQPPRLVNVADALGYMGNAAPEPAASADDVYKRWGVAKPETGAAPVAQNDVYSRWGLKPVAGADLSSPDQRAAYLKETGLAADQPGKTVRALAAGAASGVPIAGPALGAAADIAMGLAPGQAKEGAPGAYMAGGLAGATAPYVLAGGVPAAARVLGMTGTYMPAQMARGTIANGLIGAADATARGDNPGEGAAFGAAGGFLGPVVGGAVGAGVNKLMQGVQGLMRPGIPGVSKSAANLLTQVINADDPAAMKAFLAQHGDLAMMADAGPSTMGLAGGLASKPSEAKSIITNKLQERAAGSNDRITNQLDASLGPAEDPNMVARSIETLRQQQAAKAYEAAHANAPPVDISGVLSTVDNHLKTAEGMQKKALENIRSMLTEPKEVPVLNPDGTQAMGEGAKTRLPALGSQSVKGPAPVDLETFIKRAGGINDEGGDLKHMGLNHLHNPNGMTLDHAREMAAEQGYLGPNIDEAMANTFTHDLLDALGKKTYSVYDEGKLGAQYKLPGGNTWVPGAPVPLTETKNVPKTGSRNLHNIRQEIDNVINHDQPGLGVPAAAVSRSQESLQAVRGDLDKALKSQVPGMAEADANYAALAERQNAVERGYNKVLGQAGPNPETFAADRAAADPGVNVAENKGIRGRIDRMFGTGTQRDAVTLNKLLAGGEDGYSAANLKTAFGDQPVNALVDTLAREKAFNATNNEVIQNSATARRAAANKLLEDTQPGGTNLMNASLGGMAAQAGKSLIVDPLIKMIMESPNAPRNMEIAKALTAQGATRDEILQKLVEYNSRVGTVGKYGNALTNLMGGGANRLMLGAGATLRP